MMILTLFEAEKMANDAPSTAKVSWSSIGGKVVKLTINGVDFEVID